jgi:outer membrane protein OmpA-like peptidoglycan-associated protein
MADDVERRLIDEEFAELERELERLRELPVQTPREQQQALATYEAVKREWEARIAAHPDQPEWQKRAQAALTDAIGSVLRDQKSFGLDGKFTFQLDQQELKKHAAPVLDAVLQGLLTSLLAPKKDPKK